METTKRPRGNAGALPEKEESKVVLTSTELNALIASAVQSALANAAAVQPQVRSNTTSDKEFAPRIKLEEDFNKRLIENDRLGMMIAQEETVLYSIPQIYNQYVGSVTASINGHTIKIPADGVARAIPKRFVPILDKYIRNIDRKVAAMNATNLLERGGIAELPQGSI